MSLASGRRSPGLASPSAIARRISAATLEVERVGSEGLILTSNMVLSILA